MLRLKSILMPWDKTPLEISIFASFSWYTTVPSARPGTAGFPSASAARYPAVASWSIARVHAAEACEARPRHVRITGEIMALGLVVRIVVRSSTQPSEPLRHHGHQ